MRQIRDKYETNTRQIRDKYWTNWGKYETIMRQIRDKYETNMMCEMTTANTRCRIGSWRESCLARPAPRRCPSHHWTSDTWSSSGSCWWQDGDDLLQTFRMPIPDRQDQSSALSASNIGLKELFSRDEISRYVPLCCAENIGDMITAAEKIQRWHVIFEMTCHIGIKEPISSTFIK